jgi:glycosyltransferase involved in cell wall biosynthesis
MPLRILVVSNFFPPHTVGGAEIVAYRQARGLRARGHEVTVLAGEQSSETNPAGRLDFDTYDGLPVYRLSMRSLEPDLNFYWLAAARRLRAVIAANRIEVVHIHNAMGLGANLIPAVKQAGARCIVTVHDHWGFCLRATRLRKDGALCTNYEECAQCHSGKQPPNGMGVPTRLRRDYVAWCLSHADKLITPSAYLAGAYSEAGFQADSIAVISNGIDLDAVPKGPKEPSPSGAIRFLCAAYLGEHKGIFVLLEALRVLAKDPAIASRWHVTIAGEGHLRRSAEKILRASGLTGNVTLTGQLPRHQALALFARTDVTILASIWPENEPLSMLESIASGTAQIATQIGGNVELVEDRQSGFLVPPGDAAELAAAMRRYIDEPALAAMQGSYNLARRQRFDEVRALDQLEATLASSQCPAPKPGPREPVIVCGAGLPPLEVFKLVDHAHKFLADGPKARLIWREWADASVWNDATLLWLWDRHPAEWLVNMALRRGIPVLAPVSYWAEGLARHYGAVILYDTYLEALAAMKVLLSVPALRNEFASRSLAASVAATALAPRTAFSLGEEPGHQMANLP